MAAVDMRACVYCLCTDTTPCQGGCSWVEDPAGRAICSSCADSEDVAKKVVELFGGLGPRMRPPAELPSPAWADLTFDQQQLLVIAHKRLIEAACAEMADELNDQATGALVAVTNIVRFIHERAPQHLQGDEPIDDVVMTLLAPQLGSRIVLPGRGLTT